MRVAWHRLRSQDSALARQCVAHLVCVSCVSRVSCVSGGKQDAVCACVRPLLALQLVVCTP